MGCSTTDSSSRGIVSPRFVSLFDAIPAALQPSRFPIALLCVLLFGGLLSLGDALAPHDFTARGLHLAERTSSDARIAAMRAEAAVREAVADPIAFDEMLQLMAADAKASGAVRTWDVSCETLAEIARDGVASRVALIEADATLDDAARARATLAAKNGLSRALDTIDECRPRGLFESFAQEEQRAASQLVMALFALDFDGFCLAASGAIFRAPYALWRLEPFATSVVLLAILACACFAATALARMSALDLAMGRKLSAREGAWYAGDRAVRCFALPLAPVAVVVLLLLVPAILGTLSALPGVDVLSALLFPIALLFALLASVVAIVSLLALPLMPAAVAVEDSDLADAITRATSLVLARPLDWLLVLVTSLVTLAIGGCIVSIVLQVTEVLSLSAASVFLEPTSLESAAAGDGEGVELLTGTSRFAGVLLSGWLTLFHALLGAYLFSLLGELATRAYLLMRARVEGEDPTTVHQSA